MPQYLVGEVRELPDPSLFTIDFDAGKVFRESFLEPGVDLSREDSAHELVSIFVEDHVPRILHRHVQHDEAAVFATLKESS